MNPMDEQTRSCRVTAGSSKKLKDVFSKHDQAEFRANVLARYGAVRQEKGLAMAWCHATRCWWPQEAVKAAHLVPKLLTGDELAFLFGVKELVLKDSRNGISLHKNVEVALDSGKIAIVPSSATVHEHQWKCVLVDQKSREEAVCSYGSKVFQWKNLDNQTLELLTPNRPARRYLYFQFLVTYLHAKMTGNTEFTSTVDGRQYFWASPGEHLDCLARTTSGLELPPPLITNTFDDDAVSGLEAEAITLASEVCKATVESSQRWGSRHEKLEEQKDEDGNDADMGIC